ncbi:hypothetical protein AAZX31_13G345700 [Glycine max]
MYVGSPQVNAFSWIDMEEFVCGCLDEIVWKEYLENTEKDRMKRLVRLKPPLSSK